MKFMSKFESILSAKREQGTKPKATAQKAPPPSEVVPEAEAAPRPVAAKPGRPRAKRSDPNFVQTSPYIKKATLQAVKMQLLAEGQGREYSELVEELLSEWLNTRKLESLK